MDAGRRAHNELKFGAWDELPDGGRRYWFELKGRSERQGSRRAGSEVPISPNASSIRVAASACPIPQPHIEEPPVGAVEEVGQRLN